MKSLGNIDGYIYRNSDHSHAHAYLLPTVDRELEHHFLISNREKRLFDLGCGNGSVANHFSQRGYGVTGVDPSTEGISEANSAYPDLELAVGSAYDDLASLYGTFPAVTSLEVVEHVYAPRDYAATLFSLLQPGGIAIVSTPYHGYLKNLAMAVTGKLDKHFTALWDHGHIKFWSIATLSSLLHEAGFGNVKFRRVGRVPQFAKSMIAVATKPE